MSAFFLCVFFHCPSFFLFPACSGKNLVATHNPTSTSGFRGPTLDQRRLAQAPDILERATHAGLSVLYLIVSASLPQASFHRTSQTQVSRERQTSLGRSPLAFKN